MHSDPVAWTIKATILPPSSYLVHNKSTIQLHLCNIHIPAFKLQYSLPNVSCHRGCIMLQSTHHVTEYAPCHSVCITSQTTHHVTGYVSCYRVHIMLYAYAVTRRIFCNMMCIRCNMVRPLSHVSLFCRWAICTMLQSMRHVTAVCVMSQRMNILRELVVQMAPSRTCSTRQWTEHYVTQYTSCYTVSTSYAILLCRWANQAYLQQDRGQSCGHRY